MPELHIALALTPQSALSVGAAGSAGTRADKSIVRDGLGRPLIPGSHVKGKLRWAAEQLLRALNHDVPAPFDATVEQSGLIRAVFGSPVSPSPLRFAGLAADVRPQLARLPGAAPVRPSVALNRRRGTAEDQRLLLQELAPHGLIFRADPAIEGRLDSLAHAALLWAALRLTERWGGGKSRGLGWCAVSAEFRWDGVALGELELASALRSLSEQQ